MDINGWLTVITVFTAIFALLPKEDMTLMFFRIHTIEKIVLVFILLFFIPYLIIFPHLLARWAWFKNFTVQWGFNPTNIAFGLFFISFIYILGRLVWFKPNARPNQKTVDYFSEVLNEKSYEEFYKVFTNYTTPSEIRNHWGLFRPIIFHSKFLNGIFSTQSEYLLQYWDLFYNDEDLKMIFKLYLQNKNSSYYRELKENYNSYVVQDDKPFLTKIITENIPDANKYHVFSVLSDFALTELKKEPDKNSIYNQPHFHTRVSEDEGYDLPLYYHIQFIGLFYNTAITKKIDTGTTPSLLYSGFTAAILQRIEPDENDRSEYKTNYHWLIKQMTGFADTWIGNMADEYYLPNSSLFYHIPNMTNWILKELYKACDEGIISQSFVNDVLHYSVFTNYFSATIKPDFKKQIERDIIAQIPSNHLNPVLEKTLDEKFALVGTSSFLKGQPRMFNGAENKMLSDLLKFLQAQKMVSKDGDILSY